MMDLPLFIEHLGRFDPSGIEEIRLTVTGRWGRPEEEPDFTKRNTFDITVYRTSHTPGYIDPGKEDKEYEEYADEREFTHD